MADEQRPAQSTSSPKLPPLPGRASIEDLDAISGDSNTGRGKVTLATKKQGQGDNGRDPSGGRSGESQAEGLAGPGRLPAPVPDSRPASPFEGSDNILKTIADRFIAARDLQKAPAWRQLQRDLMEASPYICPVIIPYKDLIQLVADIEKELKGTTQQTGRSNEEILASFLSGGDEIPVPPIPEPTETLDTPVKIAIEG